MSKKVSGIIALEVEKYEKKIGEFQKYLEDHANFEVAEDKYKEIDAQIKIMHALPAWILALQSMKEGSSGKDKQLELRGGAEISDVAKRLFERDK